MTKDWIFFKPTAPDFIDIFTPGYEIYGEKQIEAAVKRLVAQHEIWIREMGRYA